MCVSRHVCSCVWRSVTNVMFHPQLLFYFICGGRVSQLNLALAPTTTASPNIQLVLEIPYLPLEVRLTGSLPHQPGILQVFWGSYTYAASEWATEPSLESVLKFLKSFPNSVPLNLHFFSYKMRRMWWNLLSEIGWATKWADANSWLHHAG